MSLLTYLFLRLCNHKVIHSINPTIIDYTHMGIFCQHLRHLSSERFSFPNFMIFRAFCMPPLQGLIVFSTSFYKHIVPMGLRIDGTDVQKLNAPIPKSRVIQFSVACWKNINKFEDCILASLERLINSKLYYKCPYT